MKRNFLGSAGEEGAVNYLKQNHYQIIQRNFKKKWGEIDIVAKDKKTKEIVFVEVKTRKLNNIFSLYPEEALTNRKILKLKQIFLIYLNQYHLEDLPWRFDFIAIQVKDNKEKLFIRHYKDIFLEF